MWQLAIEVKILISKNLAISNVVHLDSVNHVLSSTIPQLEKIQKISIWKNGYPKLKHATIYNDYEQGGLKNVDTFSKTRSL